MARKKQPDTAYGWLDKINQIMSDAQREIEECVAEAKHLKGCTIDFLDENGHSLFATHLGNIIFQTAVRDERGDLTINVNRLHNKVAAIKIIQDGK